MDKPDDGAMPDWNRLSAVTPDVRAGMEAQKEQGQRMEYVLSADPSTYARMMAVKPDSDDHKAAQEVLDRSVQLFQMMEKSYGNAPTLRRNIIAAALVINEIMDDAAQGMSVPVDDGGRRLMSIVGQGMSAHAVLRAIASIRMELRPAQDDGGS